MMYPDNFLGKDVLAGVVAQTEAMGMKVVATTAHRPTDTDFNQAGRQASTMPGAMPS